MPITGITEPHTYMHAYNTIPLRLADTDATQVKGYQYLVNVVSDNLYSSTSTAPYTIGNDVFYELEFGVAHDFLLGETALDLVGYLSYTIIAIPSSTSVVINEIYTGPSAFDVYRLINPYKILPDPNGYGKVDLGNTLKNYVTENFEDSNDIFAAPDTHDKFKIITGNESSAESIEFTDNFFSSGLVGFVVTDASDYEVGDTVTIQQDPLELTYNDAFSYDISVVDSSLSGQYVAYILDDAIATTLFGDANNKYNINVNGQTTYPQWNGQTTIIEPFSSTIILTNKQTNVADGTYSSEGGSLYVVATPEYNTTTSVKDKFYDIGLGKWVIVTAIPWLKSTPAISGTISLPTSKVRTTLNGPEYDLNIYNAYVNNKQWSLTAMDDYLIDNSTVAGGSATILSRTERNRIEKSTKSWLLFHNKTTGIADGVKFQFYNSTGSLLANVYLENVSGNEDDFYSPVGIDQILAATNKTDTTPLSSVVDDVDYYTVRAIKNYGTTFDGIGEIITFELNDDCSRYDLLHLIWKDAKGSWLSYPFKYIHTDSTEVSRSEFYQQPFNWDNTGFNYKGNKSYFTRGRDKKILNSGWVTEYENELIRDLLLSAHTYLQDKDGEIYGCQIITNNITFGSNQKDDLFQYTLEIKLSNDEIRL
ncbi:MAG: hypothetical protein GY870_06700 [archaeon]|nr:hypothetical protein [archaeon]